MCIYNIYISLCTIYIYGLYQSRQFSAGYALSYRTLCCNGSLVTWTVVSLTSAKFEPHIFSVMGFALSSISNIWIMMISYDFCVLPPWFCYEIVNVWSFEKHVQIADQCAPWKSATGVENLVLHALHLKKIRVCLKLSSMAVISHYWPNECFVEGYFNVST
jgi:hypothetical protein